MQPGSNGLNARGTDRAVAAHIRQYARSPMAPIGVSPMSSGLCEWGCLGVGEEVAVDDVGELAFEESEGFSFG